MYTVVRNAKWDSSSGKYLAVSCKVKQTQHPTPRVTKQDPMRPSQDRTPLPMSSACIGLLFIAVHGLLIMVASLCGAWALGTRVSVVVVHGLSSCGSQALEHRLNSCGAQA